MLDQPDLWDRYDIGVGQIGSSQRSLMEFFKKRCALEADGGLQTFEFRCLRDA